MTLQAQHRVFVAGHGGLVGSAIVRKLRQGGFKHVLTRSREELDLLDQNAVHQFFKKEKIDAVFLAAAKVGGIHANATYPADFLYENLVIATNVIHAAALSMVEKLMFLGSSCIYPKMAPQPIPETALLTSPLESTNEAYAIAKIAGLKLCEYYTTQYKKRFISAMPCNLYGPGDNFHPVNSHVIPGLMRRFHEAKMRNAPTVTVWGTGTPLREFLHVDDLAEALLILMNQYEEPTTINVGSSDEHTIRNMSELMKETIGFKGDLVFDSNRPDGTPRKVVDSSRLRALGWKPKHTLQSGLRQTYQWAVENGVFT